MHVLESGDFYNDDERATHQTAVDGHILVLERPAAFPACSSTTSTRMSPRAVVSEADAAEYMEGDDGKKKVLELFEEVPYENYATSCSSASSSGGELHILSVG